jgi:multicomponent Na+:H+ antiporter subunit B
MTVNTALNFDLGNYLLNLIIFLLILISIKIIFAKDLLNAVIAASVFSLLIGVSYLVMDAPDVAMTEAALGACLSTCVYLNLLRKLPPDLKNIERANIISASLICLLFVATLTYMGLELPNYGDNNAPLHMYSSKYYIENTSRDIGIPSFVAAILASYRGYDTLGETSVILIAGIAVLLVFSKKDVIPRLDHGISRHEMEYKIPWSSHGMTNLLKAYPIIKYITSFIIPYIILYSIYIQLNGESSPGGGFQAGVIFASSLIAYDLIYGNRKLQRYFQANILISIAVLGVAIYAIVGTISLFFNDNYLNYYSLTNFINDKLLAQHIAIVIVEIGIGLTVAAIMYLIYNIFNNHE